MASSSFHKRLIALQQHVPADIGSHFAEYDFKSYIMIL